MARSWSGAMKEHSNGLWQRLKRADLFILLAIALVIGGVWLFIELADEVNEGATAAIDQRILLALRNPTDPTDPLGPLWVEEAMRDITALGGGAILLLLTISVVGYLVIQRRYRAAVLVTLAVVGGVLLSQLLKESFGRPRPDLVPHGMHVYSTSFPSGHSMSAAATYLTLAALMARLQRRRRLRLYIMTLALLITGLVGVSRVYLGVHWPTDVLAGWTAGAVWAALCGLVMSWLQYRGDVEQHAAENHTIGAEDEDHDSG
ncbi:MAG: PAP2 family protein [Caldilinea sp. CFX5]|nr:PAP2 family protein [Caldilinea sp. CFX5]